MNQYQLTFLLNEESELKKINELITSLNGKVINQENWGEKTLAYPIKKNKKAHFYHWLIEIPKNQIKELRKKLNYNEKLIRYLILTVKS